jgi:hypothetical protein
MMGAVKSGTQQVIKNSTKIFGEGYKMTNISQRIMGNQVLSYSPHAVNQAITRGFTSKSMLDIYRYGRQTVKFGRYGVPQLHYSLKANTIVVNPFKGRVITIFSTNPGTSKGLGAGFFLNF